jgi:DNA-directed RNA polymerase subunit omega
VLARFSPSARDISPPLEPTESRMARITVEDCIDHADNRFALVILAAKRARQLTKNARPVIDVSKNKPAVMARLIYSILKVQLDGQSVSLQAAIYRTAFASWLAPKNASLAFAVAFVAFWLLILGLLHRKKIYFRV